MKPKNIFIFLIFVFFLNRINGQSAYDMVIDPLKPNYEILETALLKASNDARRKMKLPDFEANIILMQMAAMHATDMIESDFYGHQNLKNQAKRKISDRVKYVTKGEQPFNYLAENIAEFSLIEDRNDICYGRQNGKVFYFDCENRKPIAMMTYRQLAVMVVNGWINSPAHRENLFNKNYRYMGTGVRLSKNPFQKPEIPFARLVQNFGG